MVTGADVAAGVVAGGVEGVLVVLTYWYAGVTTPGTGIPRSPTKSNSIALAAFEVAVKVP